MALFNVVIGDIMINGFDLPSVDLHDPMPVHYKVMFTDMVTERTQMLHADHETHQLDILIWWLRCDDLPEVRADLVKLGLSEPFLP